MEKGNFSRFSPCDLIAFANFEPNPWPKARRIPSQTTLLRLINRRTRC
jgi:hypothetical protein